MTNIFNYQKLIIIIEVSKSKSVKISYLIQKHFKIYIFEWGAFSTRFNCLIERDQMVNFIIQFFHFYWINQKKYHQFSENCHNLAWINLPSKYFNFMKN